MPGTQLDGATVTVARVSDASQRGELEAGTIPKRAETGFPKWLGNNLLAAAIEDELMQHLDAAEGAVIVFAAEGRFATAGDNFNMIACGDRRAGDVTPRAE